MIQRSSPIVVTLLMGVIIIGGIVFYHFFDPTYSIYAPKCIVKMLTGYDCPGCGCQRLLYNWANGRFLDGLRYNYFFPIGLVYIVLILIGRKYPRLHHYCLHRTTIISFVILYIAWWIIRNILSI